MSIFTAKNFELAENKKSVSKTNQPKQVSYSSMVKKFKPAVVEVEPKPVVQVPDPLFENFTYVYPQFVVNYTPQEINGTDDEIGLLGINRNPAENLHYNLYRYLRSEYPQIYAKYERWCETNKCFVYHCDILKWIHQYCSFHNYRNVRESCSDFMTMLHKIEY
jgi:hypothetical protein